jgi:hypothetical protein
MRHLLLTVYYHPLTPYPPTTQTNNKEGIEREFVQNLPSPDDLMLEPPFSSMADMQGGGFVPPTVPRHDVY